jgi:toxin-antitoxin system PIN domain toxin
LSFPDINVWLALATSEHTNAVFARRWWDKESGQIAFSRFTQLGFLRLMTTAAAMDGKPLTMKDAWRVYDRFFDDDRVVWIPEPEDIDRFFRSYTAARTASPKIWSDAWLLAFCRSAGGILATFDRALAKHGARCLLPR